MRLSLETVIDKGDSMIVAINNNSRESHGPIDKLSHTVVEGYCYDIFYQQAHKQNILLYAGRIVLVSQRIDW